MAPKKKSNAPKNAFFFYMVEFKKKKEAEGHVFPRGLKDVSEIADPYWKGLDPLSKRAYENMAERAKVSGSGGVRYNTQGQTYDEVEREQQEAEERKELMLKTIANDVRIRGRDGLKYNRYYFIHVNHYGAMEGHRFIPCEVAVLAYSIEQGFDLTNIYHELIKNMEIPSGYTFKAQTHSEAIHKCPLPPYAMGTNNYQQIYKNILGLMQNNGDLEEGIPPPMYTLSQFMPEAIDFINKGNDFLPIANCFSRIYPLEELFFQMKNFGLKPPGNHLFFNGIEDKGFPYLANAADVLKGDIYDYSGGIACQFHEDEDVRQHCSRSYVIRWSYLFSDNLCANLDVPVVVERHTPRGTNFNSVVITTQISQMQLASKPATMGDDVESLRESCGRGKPIDGRTVSTSRSVRPPLSPNHDPWQMVPSSSRSASRASNYDRPSSRASNNDRSVSRSSNERIVNDRPITIIDHSKFQIDDSDYVPPPPAPKNAYEEGPLRLPKSKGKSSLLENAHQAQQAAMQAQQAAGGDFGQNLVMGGVGRGRGLLKFS